MRVRHMRRADAEPGMRGSFMPRAWRPGGQVKGGDPTPGPGGGPNATFHILDLYAATPRPPEAAASQECEEALCRLHKRGIEAHAYL